MDNAITLLNGLEDTRQAAVTLLSSVRRTLHLYTPYVDPHLYNDSAVLDTLRMQIINQPRIRSYLILPPADDWRRTCPHLLQLSERLSSAIELRTLPRDEPRERPEFAQAFMIADSSALLLQNDPRHFLGSHEQQVTGKVRELLNFFQELWEKSQPDPQLRHLRL